MYPELLRIPWLNLPIYGYGLMLVVGLLLAIELARFLARRLDLNPDVFSTLGLVAIFSGVAGARLLYVIQYPGQFFGPDRSFLESIKEVFDLSGGGLVYYGGVILALPVVLIYLRKKKFPLARTFDIIAPCLMVGLAFGRIGCYLNGCCWGKECDLPIARLVGTFPYGSPPYVAQTEVGKISPPPELLRDLPDGRFVPYTREEVRKLPVLASIAAGQHAMPVHPTQLYSAVTAFLLAAVLLAFMTLGPRSGTTFGLMLLLEGLARTLLESLRINEAIIGPLSISMVIGLVSAGIGLVVFLVALRFGPTYKRSDASGLASSSVPSA